MIAPLWDDTMSKEPTNIRTTYRKKLEHIYETAKHHREQEQDIEAHYEYIQNINN